MRMLMLLIALALFGCGQAGITVVQTEESLTLFDDGQPRFSYQIAPRTLNGEYERAHYLHPVWSPQGDTLTEDFPADHPHQRGLFWAWHQLFVKGDRVADPWLCEGISWEVDTVWTELGGDGAKMYSTVNWVLKESGQAVVREALQLEYRPLKGNGYELLMETTLTALVDSVEIGGSEDEKGYGGFSARLKMPVDFQIRDAAGELIEPETNAMQVGEAVNFSGTYGSHAAEVIIRVWPEELPQFQGWILRSSRSMQNPAFPGREPMVLGPKPLTFRSLVVVHE